MLEKLIISKSDPSATIRKDEHPVFWQAVLWNLAESESIVNLHCLACEYCVLVPLKL